MNIFWIRINISEVLHGEEQYIIMIISLQVHRVYSSLQQSFRSVEYKGT